MGEGRERKPDVFTEIVKAGKRTYFFDVKETHNHDLFITITESKKTWKQDGSHYYEKSKLFLYKEDFENFSTGLQNAIEKISELRETGNYSDYSPKDRIGQSKPAHELKEDEGQDFNKEEFNHSQIEFDDLD